MTPAIGIDLGTTYSAVAFINGDGVPEVIPDGQGATLVPSVVSFAGQEPVVGEAAKADQSRGEQDVVAFFKSSMGDPSYLQEFVGRDWTATDLSALVLMHLKERAESALGIPVDHAVITVPEYFTHLQRTATIEAGRLAGLQVRRIISEPTSAALAYGLRPGNDQRQVVVYDLGGGTFDVSIVRLGEGVLKVIAAAGDHNLGGRDWDDRLATHLRDRFLRETGADPASVSIGQLLVEAERLKQALTARKSAEARVNGDGHGGRYQITREDFERMTADLLSRTGQLTELALSDAGLTWADIDGVLPVGGSTRMPMVGAWIQQATGRPPMGGIHPDQAVALGAAVQAEILLAGGSLNEAGGGGELQAAPRLRLAPPKKIEDIVAHSLGMIAESADRSRYVNSVLLRRQLAIPCEAPRPYQFELRGDGTDELEVFLTQGETENPAECSYLGRYVVTGFPGAASRRGGKGKTADTAVIDITYAYDENAVVTVSAAHRDSGTPLTVTVSELPLDVPERFLGTPPRSAGRGPGTIYLAFDLSGSMSGKPLTEAQRAAEAFASQVDLTTTAVGLIGFSDKVAVELRASQNATDIGRAIRNLRCGSTGYGNATDPFDEIRELLSNEAGARYAVVLADGVWSDQPLAIKRARRCHQAGIDVIAIGFGGADERFLKDIASSTEQALFTNLNSLTQAFSTIARELTEGGGVRLSGLRQ